MNLGNGEDTTNRIRMQKQKAFELTEFGAYSPSDHRDATDRAGVTGDNAHPIEPIRRYGPCYPTRRIYPMTFERL